MQLPRYLLGKPVAPLLTVLLTPLLIGCPSSASADQLEKLLRRPLTAGWVALLAPDTREKGVAERLQLALSSQKPEVRSVAARVIGLGQLKEILGDVQAALTKESDADAAREEMRTLCSLGGPSFDETLFAAARRFAPRLDGDLAGIVARVRGAEALHLYFRSLRQLSLSSLDRQAFFRLATRGQKEQLVAAASVSLGNRDAGAWQAILNVATELGISLDQPVLLVALGSKEPVFRGEAAWHLAKTHCERPPADAPQMLEALAKAEAANGDTSDPELRFGAEILRRVLGRPPVEDEAWIACLQSSLSCHLDSDFLESPLVEHLTPREREVVRQRNEANLPPEAKSKGQGSADGEAADKATLRLLTGLPPGTARDLIEVGGCRSSNWQRPFSLATLAFRADGLPRQVTLVAVPSQGKCAETAASLFLMGLAPGDDYLPPDRKLTYVALFDPESVVCNEAPVRSVFPSSVVPQDVLRVRGDIVSPTLQKKIQPLYPEAARQDKEEGVSIYEAIITTSGCLQDIKVLKSSALLLDVSGMEAVSRWRYTPATLDGRPVRVYLTVTVTFRLH